MDMLHITSDLVSAKSREQLQIELNSKDFPHCIATMDVAMTTDVAAATDVTLATVGGVKSNGVGVGGGAFS